MSVEDAAARVLDVLNDLQVPYVLVGAFLSQLPRHFTIDARDADFVAELGHGRLAAIVERLGEFFRLDPQVSFESATGTTRHIVEYVGSPKGPVRIEFFRLSDDEFDRQRFARRIQAHLLDRPAFLLTAEDVIVTKLRWYEALHRSKDKEDARGVIAVQGDNLDWGYIYHWCDIHGTRELLKAVRASIPPI